MNARGAELATGQDVRDLLGLRTRAAKAVVVVFCASFCAVAYTNLPDAKGVWGICGATALVTLACVAIIVVPGDPLPTWWSAAIALVAPASCVLVLWELPDSSWNMDQVWNLRATTAILTYLAVRGRVGFTLFGSISSAAMCMSWTSWTGQGISAGISVYSVNFGPILMSVVFASTIRPMASLVYSLRAREAVRAGKESGSLAAIEERNRQLSLVRSLSGDLLERAAAGAIFSEEDRLACRVAEAALRDLLRAPVLAASQSVLASVRDARRRGCVVVLLDDRENRRNEFDHLDEVCREIVRVASGLADGGSMTVRINPDGRDERASVVSYSADISERGATSNRITI